MDCLHYKALQLEHADVMISSVQTVSGLCSTMFASRHMCVCMSFFFSLVGGGLIL